MTYTTISWCIAALLSLQAPRGLIEQALEEPTQITLEQVTLREAIERLTEQTGVRIVMPPEVMALAPHGAQTVVQRVTISDLPLRQALIELFAPLGMTFVVRDGFVEVVPKGALLCLGRAASWRELETLAQLSASQPGIDPEALARLRPRVQFQTPAGEDWDRLADVIRAVGAGPGDEVLTVAAERLGWAWCLSDDRIVITSVADLIRRQLRQRVSLRINSRPLIEILQALSERVRVPIRIEPGAIRTLPLAMQRNGSLNVADTPADHVLDRISAETGLGYLIEPGGVLFYQVGEETDRTQAGVNQAQAASFASDPYVGKLVVPLADGTSVEWHIRRSELPLDLRKKREADLKKAFEQLRKGMQD